MANFKKVVVQGKVQKHSSKKFRVSKHKDHEFDIDIEIDEDGDYEVEKLSVDELPTHMPDSTPIRWFNNFSVKKGGKHINQKYRVTVAGLSKSLAKSRLVIYEGSGDPYYYDGPITNDTFELTNGDPGTGFGP